jgi:thioredoxin 1
MSNNILNVTDSNFEDEVLKSERPVVLDFWAEWCGPCKNIAPILDELAGEYKNKLIIAKINIDENQKIPATYGVKGIPTLILFKEGEVIATNFGQATKSQLEAFFDTNI